jgi:glycogen(starch) synthase
MVTDMRIWLAPSRYAPHLGGIETVVSQLASELTAAGDQVLVLTHRHPPGLPADEVLDGVRVHRPRFESPARDIAATRRFLRSYASTQRFLATEPRPDVIHLHGGSGQLLHLTRFAGRHRIPLILTTHGEISGDVHDVYGRSVYVRSSFRYAARRAAAVSAPSRQTLEEAARLEPRALPKGTVVPNGIRAEHWRSCPPPNATGRVLAWGRLEQQKGFDRLLAAWPSVRRRLPHAELRIAGEGGERAALEALLSPGVLLLGRLDRPGLVRELAGAQLAAVPSRVEAFGMSALEALAGGRPVLHAGLPALSEVVGPHGWVAGHDDPEVLAEAVVAALSAPPRAVPPEAVGGYHWPVVVGQYRRLYLEAAERVR